MPKPPPSLEADPDCRVQWGDGVVLVWTTPRPAMTGRASGVLLELELSADIPNLRSLPMRARSIDDRLLEVVEPVVRGGVVLRWQDGARAVEPEQAEPVLVDLFSGRVDCGLPGSALSGLLAARLRDALDGELLDALWLAALDVRGVRADYVRSCVRGDGWKPGNLATWNDAAGAARPDVYPVDERSVLVEEFFCPMPRCDCREAVVSFTRLFDDGTMRAFAVPPPAGRPPEQLGEVSVPFDGDGFHFQVPEGPRREELESAWHDYVARWPRYRRRLFGRYQRLRAGAAADLRECAATVAVAKATAARTAGRAVGAASAGASGSGFGGAFGPGPARALLVEPMQRGDAKVGRNAPCPCGSGRKYKKCCLQRDSQA